ncbi:MAG: single-stranded DNA-binding protein [Alteromonadaceae bacterium]|nr:single-stranded DNA-binding protein [Alteromonadaceae bacterium]
MPHTLNKNCLCSVTLLGNLVAMPEIRYQANPIIAVAEFTLATHSRWLDKKTNKYKEWTNYHVIKVIGDMVEQVLINAQKGDVVLIHGYLLNSKKAGREIIHASFAQTFAKGYAQSLNQIQCSGVIASEIKLVTTEQNKTLAEVTLSISHQVYSTFKQEMQKFTVERPVHIWGNQANYIKEHAQIGDQIVLEGKLNYLNNADKSQYIDAKQVVLLKS